MAYETRDLFNVELELAPEQLGSYGCLHGLEHPLVLLHVTLANCSIISVLSFCFAYSGTNVCTWSLLLYRQGWTKVFFEYEAFPAACVRNA